MLSIRDQARKYADFASDRYNNANPAEPRILEVGLYDLPISWCWTDIGSIVTHLVDCVNDTPDFSLVPTEYIGLKSSNIRPYSLDLSEKWFMTAEDFEHWNRRERPKPGDIVITREAPMGNSCIVPSGYNLCLTQRIMLMRCDEEFVTTRYVLHYLNTSMFLGQVLGASRGLTHPHLRVGDAPRILVPLAPLDEQRHIVAYLDDLQAQVDALKRLQTESAAELDALLPSVLDRAFRGEL